MKLSEQMRARIAGLVQQRTALHDEQAAILAGVEARADKKITDDEQKTYDEKRGAKKALDDEITECEARLEELLDEEARDEKAAEHRAKYGVVTEPRAQVNEPDLYRKGGPDSYFRDLFNMTARRDVAAGDRLQRHASVMESRAMGNTNAAGGSGGEFAPPTWVVNEWINLIRPGRVTVNLFRREDVPSGTSSVNYPRLTGGTSVALQSTQNSTLASTDPTTSYVQAGFATIGGKNVISQQLIDQTAVNFDQVVLDDLGAAYAQQIGALTFTGTGTGTGTNSVINGLLNATISNTVTWTQGTPTPAGFYGQSGKLLQAFLAARLMPPTHWIMHPRRWFWLESSVDSNGRPLVVPDGNAYNPVAVENGVVAYGQVGTFHGLPVVIDPLVPINQGGGTNQDLVYLVKADDLVLFESGPMTEVFREPYAEQLGVLLRLYAYAATILNRHPESIGVLTGTGLVPPTFAS